MAVHFLEEIHRRPSKFTTLKHLKNITYLKSLIFRIRIHIPVKHHTHTHVITKVKKVHVAVPIKEEKKPSHYEELDDWSWDLKKSGKGKKSYI